jgi:hypothetical protein
MEKKDTLTKILAVAGIVLIWLTILAPILFSVIRLIMARRFLFDYLLPAELFPIALVGGGLLLWAALRRHAWQKLIGWGLVSAIVLLGGGQGLAVVTGLASGETAPTGWWWALTLAAIIAYDLVLVLIGIGGVLLLRDLFKPSK